MARSHRMTAYDIMEARGVFSLNPANADSRADDGEPLYKGPVKYPKMMYHPEGKERILVPGEPVLTRDGQIFLGVNGQPQFVGEQRELIWQLAEDEAREEELRLEGWHDHPAQAIAASGRPAPPMGAQARVDSLEAQVERLKAKLAELGEPESI